MFPMESFKGQRIHNLNPVQNNRLYHVPTDEMLFLLDNQPGQETFYFYATKTPDPRLEKLETKHLHGFQPVPDHILTYLNSKERATVSSHQAGTSMPLS